METSIWKTIEERLASFCGHICLNADGYRLSLVRQLHKNRLVIVVYINGVIEFKWSQYLKVGEAPYEEARRFFQPLKKNLHTPKEKKLFEKLRKLGMKEMASGERVYYRCWWADVKPLIRHLKKTCKSVTLWQEPETNVPVDETNITDSETKSSVADTKKTRV